MQDEKVKELHSPGASFPVAVALVDHKGVHASDFSNPAVCNRYFFGLHKEGTVQQLRQLADDIEAGRKVFQEATVYSKAVLEDFTFTTLRLKWADGHK